MARIVFNPFHAGQTTVGLRSRNSGITLSGPTSSIFSRSVWTPPIWSSPWSTPFYSQPVYHYTDHQASAQALLVTVAVAAALVGAAIYFSPTDCIEQCVYNWEGVGVCECIEYLY